MYKTRENGKVKMVFVDTPLLKLPIDIVEDVIVGDSLHLLHLGITKKLLSIYKDGHFYHKKWSVETVSTIDKILTTVKLPLEIHRQGRGLLNLTHWKASECASFLNYIGIAILPEFIDKEHYENFANLFCAVTICSSEFYVNYLPVAAILFENFVENYDKFFKTVSSNQHNLVHVVDEVRRFGPLNTIASYPFENHLYHIKKLVRSGRLPLHQIVNRITEKQRQSFDKKMKLPNYPLLQRPYSEDTMQFSRVTLSEGFILQNNFADMWFLSKNKKIIAMISASVKGVLGKALKNTEPQFKSPLKSFDLNVLCTFTDNTFEPNRLYSFKEILCKLVAIPIGKKTVYVPLQHTLCTI